MILGTIILVLLCAWSVLAIRTICQNHERRIVLTSFSLLITGVLLVVMFSVNTHKVDHTLLGESIDLSVMSVDKEYEYLAEISSNPQEYLERTIRIKGIFYAQESMSEEGKMNYYCVVQNEEGSSIPVDLIPPQDAVYPDDFPELGMEICVQGTFSAFQDEAHEGQLYCALVLQ